MNDFFKSWRLPPSDGRAGKRACARAAAQTGSISGTILDVSGKPWAEVGIRSVSDQAQSRRPDG